ncbi:heme ABC transporter ATP-binding protein [Brachybacterium sp. EE-P12]|uniref:heme ABC transporter ATP-binding protein n=1 Tax=Brachybacterium sp. EE-P12 TaxID=2306299 RepID=UPI000F08D458|nr:heme ABC transporter ATP-binding protein [Brachybacterium sp. EE-P12]
MSTAPLSPGEVTLEARGVTVHLGGTPILTEVDLDLRRGEVTVLVGPNGAGKSTLFGVLAGDIAPRAGTVRIIAGSPAAGGSASRELADVSALRPKELSRRRAVQMQDSRLAFSFTARDAVEMGRAPWVGTPEEERDDEVIAAALAAGEVTHLAARQVPSLSGGERSRVAFARLLAQETEILLLDEPTAALDIRHQEHVIAAARARARAGATVMVIVHDLSLAAAYADRIVLLEDGRVRAVGSPAEVLTAELLSEVYQHPVTVLTAPEGGELLIVPVRRRPDADAPAPLEIPMELPA